ncbi:TPA: transcriptional regulator [Vibrio cholerae]|nr:helix-turn-helix domain-containing protein [Vibrio mimicus]QXC58387.1 helix-turn-helix domain-containing protein [Vibrio mimicus]HDI3207312.1 transcriptional regulator [Vibrio cholerae]HDZ9205691.1 transcriptional regulator [Vibrio cholerae]
MNLSFEERLNSLLLDRKQTPWGKSLGFTSASISRIFSGDNIPGAEFLFAIKRAENANLNWLLAGEGAPYIVNYIQNAADLANQVKAMLEDEPWTVYLCELTERCVLVLTQPGQYEFKGKFIDYQIIEIITGPSSDELNGVIRNHKNSTVVPLNISEHLDSLVSGNLGTYQLLTSNDAILKNCRAVSDEDLTAIDRAKTIETELMRAVVKLVEECASESRRILTPTQKAKVIAAVYQNSSRLSLKPSEIDSETVRTAIDVIAD